MDIKLETGIKLKLKDVSLDERDELLDSVEYKVDAKGKVQGVKMMNSTITKWLRTGLDGDTSDKFLKTLSFEDRVEIFTKMQENILVGEEKASD
tara:strand:- start:2245 stop:2526 length:282 start_codon:yes stop_codon:yes gene_type:complete